MALLIVLIVLLSPPKAPLVHLYELIGLERAQARKGSSYKLWPEAMSYGLDHFHLSQTAAWSLSTEPDRLSASDPILPPPLVPGFILIDLELQLARAGGKTTSTPLLLFLLLFVAQAIATAWRASLEIEVEEAAG